MTVRSIRGLALIAAVSLLIGCAQSVTGLPSVAGDQADSGASGPMTASRPGAGGRTPSSPATGGTLPTVGTTTIVPSTSARPSTPSGQAATITSADTITEYTTVFDTSPDPTSAERPPAHDPAGVIGSPDLGPDANGFVNFQSPSGNIMCSIIDSASYSAARCDISDWHYPTPSQTQNCGEGGGWHGGTASVDASDPGAVGACVGDTVADPSNPVLAYGQNAGVNDYGCHAAENGVTCANLLTRHGFRLSRDSYDVF